jgi:hypothetical protein
VLKFKENSGAKGLIHIPNFAASELNGMKFEMAVLVLIMYRWRWN